MPRYGEGEKTGRETHRYKTRHLKETRKSINRNPYRNKTTFAHS